MQKTPSSLLHVARHTLMYSIESFTSTSEWRALYLVESFSDVDVESFIESFTCTSEWRALHLGGRIVCRATRAQYNAPTHIVIPSARQ